MCLLVPSVLLALTLSTSQNLDLAANICTPHLIVQLNRAGRIGLTANRHDHDDGNSKDRPRGLPLLLMSSYVLSFYLFEIWNLKALYDCCLAQLVCKCRHAMRYHNTLQNSLLGSQEQTNLSGP